MTRFSVRGVAPSSHMPVDVGSRKLSFEMNSTLIPTIPVASISTSFGESNDAASRVPGTPLFLLAKAPSHEKFRVIRVKGDGRCMFRALALGLARNKGQILGATAEEQEADQLRLAVAEALCRSPKRRTDFGDAVIAVNAEDKLQK